MADDETGDSDDHRGEDGAKRQEQIRRAQAVLSRLGYLTDELSRLTSPVESPGEGSSPGLSSGPPVVP